jgi:predicted site-specific integrase-resolvase
MSSLKSTAAQIGYSTKTLKRWATEGKIASEQRGCHYFFDMDVVRAYVERVRPVLLCPVKKGTGSM